MGQFTLGDTGAVVAHTDDHGIVLHAGRYFHQLPCPAVLCGIVSGILCCLLSVLFFAAVFKVDHATYVTLLPKSITTAIGIGLSEELNGYVAITVAAIMITGLFGNIAGAGICKLFGIKHPVAKGIAIGTATHVMGTAKAMEIGEVEGAMSSLSVAVAGCITVGVAIIFEGFI